MQVYAVLVKRQESLDQLREIKGNIYVFWAEGERVGKIISSRSRRGHCVGEDVFELFGISECEKADILCRLDELLVPEPIYYYGEGVKAKFSLLLSNSMLLCLAVEQAEPSAGLRSEYESKASGIVFQREECCERGQSALCEPPLGAVGYAPIMYENCGFEWRYADRDDILESVENRIAEILRNAAEMVGLEFEYGIFSADAQDNAARSVFLPELCFAIMLVLMMTAREFSFNRKLSADIISCGGEVKIRARLDDFDEHQREYNEALDIIVSAFGASIQAELCDGMNIYEFIPYSIDEGQSEVKTDLLEWNYD